MELMRQIDDQLNKDVSLFKNLYHEQLEAILYTYAIDSVLEFIKTDIENVLEENSSNKWANIIVQIKSDVTFDRLLEFCLSSRCIKIFSKVLELCNRRILVILDDFNLSFDKFRLKDSIETVESGSFENVWVRTIIETIYEIRDRMNVAILKPLFNLMDICICIPHDRFVNFTDWNRNSIKYVNTIVDLEWSGVELAILLRKRLELIFRDLKRIYNADESLSAEDRLWEELKNKFCNIPKTLSLLNEDLKKFEIDLFQYVLRVSL